MKQRHGFVSNSSSSSFLIVAEKGAYPLPEECQIASSILMPRQARAVIRTAAAQMKLYMQYSENEAEEQKKLDHLLQLQDKTDAYHFFLTQFISDSTSTYSQLYNIKDIYTYCSGNHDGPYCEEEFDALLDAGDSYCDVWIQKTDNKIPQLSEGEQAEFEFVGEELDILE